MGEVRTLTVTQVPNPVTVAKRKTAALKQHLESKIGPRSSSDFNFRVILIRGECDLDEDCRHKKLVTYTQIPEFIVSLRTGWWRWFVEKIVPRYPVWLSGYTQLKLQLGDLPSVDILQWKNGERWYGELRRCPDVLYDRSMVAELSFTERKGGVVFGNPCVEVQGVRRRDGGKMFATPFRLGVENTLEFLCVDSETTVSVKLVKVARVVLSKPT